MKNFRTAIIHALNADIDNLIASPPRSFMFEGTAFFPNTARAKRHYLTDDIADLLILVRGEDNWEAWARVAVRVSADDHQPEIFRPATYLIIDDFSSSDPGEPSQAVEARASAWANGL